MNSTFNIQHLTFNILHYSALSASIGRILAALMAGMSPAMVPAMTMVMVAPIQVPMPTVGFTNMAALNSPVSTVVWPMVASMISFAATPQTIPM